MDNPQTMQRLVQYGRIVMADLLRHDKRDPVEFYAVIILILHLYLRIIQLIKLPYDHKIVSNIDNT